jgi:hypothetical protein
LPEHLPYHHPAIPETEKKHKSTIFIAEGCALIFGGTEVEMTSVFYTGYLEDGG